MSAKGDRTREHLIDVAERLLGERGLHHVSLREIRLAAGQANVGAMQYHFGDRDGLLRAIAERHLARLTERRAAIAQANPPPRTPPRTPAARRRDVRRLFVILLGPYLDDLEAGPSERAWVKLNAEFLRHPRMGIDELTDHTDDLVMATGIALYDHLVDGFPPDLAAERLLQVVANAANALADRAAWLDAPEPKRPQVSHAAFRANLLDMSCGALLAPLSDELRAASDPALLAARTTRTRRPDAASA